MIYNFTMYVTICGTVYSCLVYKAKTNLEMGVKGQGHNDFGNLNGVFTRKNPD